MHQSDNADSKNRSEFPTPLYCYAVSIATIGSRKYELRYPAVISIHCYHEEYIAIWPELDQWGSGRTDTKAIDTLKKNVRKLFHDIFHRGDGPLSRAELQWRAISEALLV